MIYLLFLLALLLACPVWATTWYVSASSGSDSNTCTQAQSTSTPKLTIAAGIGCLQADPLNNRLEIRAGTYNEIIRSSVTTLPVGTTWANAPTIAAYTGESVTLNGSGAGAVLDISTGGVQYLIFDGLKFDGVNNSSQQVIALNGAVGYVRITNGEIKNASSGYNGISCGATVGNFEILNNKIYDNGPTVAVYGLYWNCDNSLIEGNEIYGNGGWGIHLYPNPTSNTVRKNIVRNNGLCNCGAGGIIVHDDGNKIYNNLVYDNRRTGIDIHGNNQIVYGNTVDGNDTEHVNVGNIYLFGGSGHLIKNNIASNAWNSALNIVIEAGASATWDQNLCSHSGDANCEIVGDPLYVNRAAKNFALQSGSPAKDAGAALGAPYNVDYAGVSRPQGSAWDIGAYEFAGQKLQAPGKLTITGKVVIQ